MYRLLAFLSVAWATTAAAFMNLPDILQALMILMGLDIALGAICAFAMGKLSSDVAWRGITKKVAILAIVLMTRALEPMLAPMVNLPLSQMVGAYYVFVEALSIVENAAVAGIPIPSFLKDALAQLSPDKLPPPQDPNQPKG